MFIISGHRQLNGKRQKVMITFSAAASAGIADYYLAYLASIKPTSASAVSFEYGSVLRSSLDTGSDSRTWNAIISASITDSDAKSPHKIVFPCVITIPGGEAQLSDIQASVYAQVNAAFKFYLPVSMVLTPIELNDDKVFVHSINVIVEGE